MRTLFIDTHSENLEIAVIDGDTIYSEIKTGNRNHSEIAISTLKSVLGKSNVSLKSIDEIIVVNGPGSFTGVRIGVTIAKTIAYSLDIPIKTITSLEAYGVSSKKEYDLVVINDSKGVYSALYKDKNFSDFSYRKNSDFNEYIKDSNYRICTNDKIDLNLVLSYLKDREYTNPHYVNPIYIKEIML